MTTTTFSIVSAAAKTAYNMDHNPGTCGCGNENDAPLAGLEGVYFGSSDHLMTSVATTDLEVAKKQVKFAPYGCACGYGGVFEALLVAENLGALRAQGDCRSAEEIADLVVGEWNRIQAEETRVFRAESAERARHASDFIRSKMARVEINDEGEPVVVSIDGDWKHPVYWMDRKPTLWAWVKIWFARKY